MAKTRISKSRLGRGLSSLMTGSAVVPNATSDQENGGMATGPTETRSVETAISPSGDASELVHLSVSDVTTNPYQPRKQIDPDSLSRLVESVRRDGVMQPVIVRPAPGSTPGDARHYELVVGERRWRAAIEAGLQSVPALIRDMDDRQIAQWALVENLQREDLNPLERAEAFRSLSDEFGLGHEQIAQQVSVDRSTVSNTLRLLALQRDVQQMVRGGQLSAGQARALGALSEHHQQLALAREAVQKDLSVRQVEAAVRQCNARDADGGEGTQTGSSSHNRPHLTDLEKQLVEQLQMRVKIRPGRKKGSGSLTIHFDSLDAFDGILSRLDIEIE